MPMLLGITGERRSGKDTIADYLVSNYGCHKHAFATPLKNTLAHLFMFTYEQLYGDEKEEVDAEWGISPRRAMQLIGTDMMREVVSREFPNSPVFGNNGFWVHHFRLWYARARADNPNMTVVVSDVRFQNELDLIHALGGRVLRVTRPAPPNHRQDDAVDAHPSEAIDNLTQIDATVVNDSTRDVLFDRVRHMFGLPDHPD